MITENKTQPLGIDKQFNTEMSTPEIELADGASVELTSTLVRLDATGHVQPVKYTLTGPGKFKWDPATRDWNRVPDEDSSDDTDDDQDLDNDQEEDKKDKGDQERDQSQSEQQDSANNTEHSTESNVESQAGQTEPGTGTSSSGTSTGTAGTSAGGAGTGATGGTILGVSTTTVVGTLIGAAIVANQIDKNNDDDNGEPISQ